jgi:HSP20 family protein
MVVVLTFDPFREMDRLTSQLLGADAVRSRTPRWMPMDLYRAGDHFVLNVDLPGVDPGSIDVDVDGNTLSIRAERSVAGDEGVEWIAQERPAGSFLRQLNLGEGLDLERIDAAYNAGVLTLTIPVSERAKPRKIAVTASGGPQQVEQSRDRVVEGEVATQTG